MPELKNQNGQLLLPILAVMFLFGMFWVVYIRWCQKIYWQMRMDMAADAVALSAAREEAAMLNTIGARQVMENFLVQKGNIDGEDVAIMEKPLQPVFELYNWLLLGYVKTYTANVLKVAKTVAKANGANHLPIPIPVPQHHLKPQEIKVTFLVGYEPDGSKTYPKAYFARDWWPRKRAPQPIHRTTWLVGHDRIWEKGKARLWLDVDPKNKANNGGFPSEQATGLAGLGIQCNFPQFSARLMTKYFGSFVFDIPGTDELQGSGAH